MDDAKQYPTMIIPAGTEIAVNEQGQLSIRTPGNLVIQNSGVYSVIESGAGSVRIDPNVKVEAISVQAADSCYVAGELTAWRVKAGKLTLEKGAVANIMLQESDTLELDRNARLIGNFASEKELYLMLGRFNRQLRQLPDGLAVGSDSARANLPRAAATSRTTPSQLRGGDPFASLGDEAEPPPAPVKRQERSDVLGLVRVIVEREIGHRPPDEPSRAALESLLQLVRSADLGALRDSYRHHLAQVPRPSDELDRARGMLDHLFGVS